MGSCCSTEEEKHEVQTKHKDPKKSGGVGNANIKSETPGTHFNIEGSQPGAILEYVNQTVASIYSEKGPFKGTGQSGDNVEFRPLCILENGARYEGEWNKATGEREGKGIQVWADGSMYEGYWKNSKANGKGRLIHADGDVYEGEWKDDKANGYGTYVHTDGA